MPLFVHLARIMLPFMVQAESSLMRSEAVSMKVDVRGDLRADRPACVVEGKHPRKCRSKLTPAKFPQCTSWQSNNVICMGTTEVECVLEAQKHPDVLSVLWRSLAGGAAGCQWCDSIGDPGTDKIKDNVIAMYPNRQCMAEFVDLQANNPGGVCQDGDVKATDADLNDVQPEANQAFVPNVNFEGEWYPICGHWFWNSNDGATIVCQKLGFDLGTHQELDAPFTKDAIQVGRCNPGEELTSCTAGGNSWPTVISECESGQPGGSVTVTCQGGSEHKQATCAGAARWSQISDAPTPTPTPTPSPTPTASGSGDVYCVAPDDDAGYKIKEKSLNKNTFNVTAKCLYGEAEKGVAPTLTACTENGQPYTLKGCVPKAGDEDDDDDSPASKQKCSSTASDECLALYELAKLYDTKHLFYEHCQKEDAAEPLLRSTCSLCCGAEDEDADEPQM